MSSPASSDELIGRLTGTLRPQHPLPAPWQRAAIWLGVVAVAAAGLAGVTDLRAVGIRLAAAPDMWLAVLGSVSTAVLAAIAAFQLCLPDRSPRWALLPLPGVALWLGASGLGCLRSWVLPDRHTLNAGEAMHCMKFIIAVSLPLSILLIVMLRRGFSLRPNLTAILGGLAAAAAAASLLALIHPYDAAATDLGIHFAAVLLVVGVNLVIGNNALK